MAIKNKRNDSGRGSTLSHLRSPLVFFGLSLLVVESAFGACILKYSGTEHTVVILASWMGGIFVLSILAVSFLTYKVPKNIIVEVADQKSKELDDTQELYNLRLQEAEDHYKRVHSAVATVFKFAKTDSMELSAVLDMLAEVETILSPNNKAQLK